MDKVKRFFELKELWKKAPETERARIDREIDALLDSMDEADGARLETAVTEDFQRMHRELKEIEQVLTVRKQLEPVLPLISVSALSKKYFGKSSSWFYQRLNGNVVHGKPAAFTEDELKTLNHALQDISLKLSNVACFA